MQSLTAQNIIVLTYVVIFDKQLLLTWKTILPTKQWITIPEFDYQSNPWTQVNHAYFIFES